MVVGTDEDRDVAGCGARDQHGANPVPGGRQPLGIGG